MLYSPKKQILISMEPSSSKEQIAIHDEPSTPKKQRIAESAESVLELGSLRKTETASVHGVVIPSCLP